MRRWVLGLAIALLCAINVAHGQVARVALNISAPAGDTVNIYRANTGCSPSPSFTKIVSDWNPALPYIDNPGQGTWCYTTTLVDSNTGAESSFATPSQTTITVAGGGGAVPTLTVSPAYQYPALQTQNNDPGTWGVCDAGCAGSPDNSSGTSTLSFNIQSPSLSGSAMELNSTGSNYWSSMFYRHLGCPGAGCTSLRNFVDDVYFEPNSTSGVQAIEFDPDYWDNSWAYFMSVQCRLIGTNAGNWFFWNTLAKSWTATQFPCTAQSVYPGKFHHLQLYGVMNLSNHTYTYETMVLDGSVVFQNLGKTFNAEPTPWPGADPSLNIQQQVDGNSGSFQNIIYYDNYSLTVW